MTKYTYTKTDSGTIIRTDEDGKVWSIPAVEGNLDYAKYLESLDPKTKAPKVVDEAAPL